MKFSLVSALVLVLAIAHGTESVTLVKRDAPYDVEKITQLIQDMTTSISTAAHDMVEKVKAHELTVQAQTYIADGKAQVQPLVEKVQAEAEKIQEQLKPILANIQEQLKPLTDNLDSHVKPIVDNLEAQFKPMIDNLQAQIQPLTDPIQEQVMQIIRDTVAQAKALLPPQ